MTRPRTRPILIVDDDPEAVALTTLALAKAGIKARVDAIMEVAPAISYLKRRLAKGEHALPLLLFLDLTRPAAAGFKLLDWIRNQPPLRRWLTVVLTSSPKRGGPRKPAGKAGADAAVHEQARGPGGRSLFQLANMMLTVEEIEKFVLPRNPPDSRLA